VTGIRKEQDGEVVLIRKLLVTFGRIPAYPDNLCAEIGKFLESSVKPESLKGAPGCIIPGIKVKNDPFPAESIQA